MTRIAAVFLISIYGLKALAGLMLAYAEESAFPQILTPPLALVAYLLTERSRRVYLPVFWANLLGLAAFAAAGWQMLGNTTEGRLLAGAHLVVYLTWIFLFQRNRVTKYWWMCALSVPQVAVGAILTNSGSYGGLLIVFMFAAIWTLSVFSLYQAELHYSVSEGNDDATAKFSLESRPARNLRFGRSAAENLARTLFLRPSLSRGTIQLDAEKRWLGMRFGLSMLATSSAALVVAAAFFLFIPRLWAGRNEWGSPDSKQFKSIAMAGFTEKIRLGDLVPLLENSQRVLQVSLFGPDGTPLDVEQYCRDLGYAEPLFRGATMERYENGTWHRLNRRASVMVALSTKPEFADSVRQQILMEPIGTPILFAIHPVEQLRLPSASDQAELHPYSNQVSRPDNVSPDKAIAYTVYSPPPEFALRTRREMARRMNDRGDEDGYFREYQSLPEKKLARLVKLARDLTGYNPRQPRRPGEGWRERNRRCADTLCRYLRDSGNYRYALDASVEDPAIDPVEDFLFNRHAGHCEYFASALALMLRAVGIPARVVSGFKGGTVNAISGVYEVEQRHAHAWVEMLQSGPIGENPGDEERLYDESQYWVTLDPTPEAREQSVASYASQIRAAHELASVVSSTWQRFMNMDIAEQQTAFYVPVVNAFRSWWNPPEGERPFLARIFQGIVAFVTDPTQWFTATGIVAATTVWAAGAAFIFLWRMRRKIWKRLLELWQPRGGGSEMRIAFYERFERLCAQFGLVRRTAETQREFAGTVGPRIREIIASADGLPDLPPRLVEFFYRVRFGNEELSHAIIDDLNSGLTMLEAALRAPNRNVSGPRVRRS